jgi:hypothetical protein
MSEKIPVKNEKIVRDVKTNALIFTDTEATDRYEKRKSEILREKQELDTLKSDVLEIKEMLKHLLNRESK